MSDDNESRDIQSLLQQAHDAPPPDPGFVKGLGARLARELSETRAKSGPVVAHAPRPRRWRWLLIPAAAAAIVLVAVTAYSVRRSGDADRPEKDMKIAQINPKIPDGNTESKPMEKESSKPLEKESLKEVRTDYALLKRELSLRERSLEQHVADAQVIVVATALDSAPAPPKRPGDLPEVLIRFRVSRVLKGKLADKIITTRTPTAADEFIGKEWVVMLSPEYMAEKHQFAACYTIKLEPNVKAILSKDKK